MNRRGQRAVIQSTGTQSPVLALLLLCLALSHCVEIDGGASELSWELRTFDGERVSCAEAKISEMRLCWTALDDESTGCRQFRTFTCEDLTGVTLFEIDPGPTKLRLEPICTDGQAASSSTYQGPPEIVRSVRDGEVVTLGALLIAVSNERSCPECTCVRSP